MNNARSMLARKPSGAARVPVVDGLRRTASLAAVILFAAAFSAAQTPPSTPTGFTVSDVPGTVLLKFKWDFNPEGVENFVIEQQQGPVFSTLYDDIGPSTIGWTGGLFEPIFKPGETYSFRIFARNQFGESEPSEVVTVSKYRAGASGTYRIQVVATGNFLNHDEFRGTGNPAVISTLRQARDLDFRIEEQPDGTVRVGTRFLGKYLAEVDDGQIFADHFEDDESSRFVLEDQGDGTFRVRVLESGRYWHNDGLGTQLLGTVPEQENDDFSRFRLVKRSNVLCEDSETSICLTEGRFQVSIEFSAPGEDSEFAQVVEGRSDDSGLFSFFDPNNWELLIKVLDACSFNDRFWVFWSATTNVEFELTVTDTLTSESRAWSNPQGNLAEPVADTQAFATCTADSD